MKIYFTLFLLLTASITLAKSTRLETAPSIDIDRYMGKWYEIARFDQPFQKGCTATEAIYEKRDDGDIKIINRCRLHTPRGELKEAIGRAWVKSKETNSKLKVQFFLSNFRIPLFAGDYWVLELGESYEYAMIGDPSRRYLWILSRTSDIDQELYDKLVSLAKEKGFNISKLLKTLH